MGCTNDKSKQIEKEIESILEADIISNQPSGSMTQQEGKLKDFFKVEGAIGKGAYGRVYKIISLVNGAEYVVKMVKKDPQREQQIIEKIRVIENLDHPNIAKISKVYADSRFYYLVQDYCTGGELLDKLLLFNYLNEDIAANIMHQILSALVQLHSKQLIHRDLCLRSLFLEFNDINSAIKIIDFAYSIFLHQKERIKQPDFQPYFIAPEVATGNFEESSDVWSCGVILFFLLSGKPPFQGDDIGTIMRQAQKGEYNFNEAVWKTISMDARNLIKQMLTVDVIARPSAQQCLENIWFQRISNITFNFKMLDATISNLRSFNTNSQLQRIVISFMANEMSSKQEIEEMKKQFKLIDKNEDNLISKQELIDLYIKTLNPLEAEQEVDRIFQQCDTDKSGTLDFNEFIAASMNRKKLLQSLKVEEAFRRIDQNGDGKITSKELYKIFGKQSNIQKEEWQEIISEIDRDKNGQVSNKQIQIDFNEFKAMLLKMM